MRRIGREEHQAGNKRELGLYHNDDVMIIIIRILCVLLDVACWEAVWLHWGSDEVHEFRSCLRHRDRGTLPSAFPLMLLTSLGESQLRAGFRTVQKFRKLSFPSCLQAPISRSQASLDLICSIALPYSKSSGLGSRQPLPSRRLTAKEDHLIFHLPDSNPSLPL